MAWHDNGLKHCNLQTQFADWLVFYNTKLGGREEVVDGI